MLPMNVVIRYSDGAVSLLVDVIGDVVGSSLPEEIVLLAAHLDSWDLGQGAIDDGAGCGIILEAGRQIALMDPRPKRTVRVVFFADEEHGLFGIITED